jgi:DNA-binding IclR family transcriptional regulator
VLAKALSVLDLFSERAPEWNATDLARELGLPVSTAHRITRSLESHGLVTRTRSGRYRLGMGAISLGRRATASLDVRVALRPFLEELAAYTGETVVLSVYDERSLGALCVDRIEAAHPLRLSLEVGSMIPLHAGASSKALLAFLGDTVLEAVLSRPLERLASHTLTKTWELRREMGVIRQRGWAFSREETNDGAWGVAAPVLGPDGVAVAVIDVAAPTARHSAQIEARWASAVSEAARRAGAAL